MTTPINFDERAFRDALGTFVTGVTIVTCDGPDGPIGITANSFSSLSLNPPLVLWSPAKTSRRYEPFVTAKTFAVHIASHDQLDMCNGFAKSAQGPDGLEWQHSDNGCPYIDGAVTRFMCEQYTTFDGGDHTIIVGKVTDFSTNDSAPLIFSRGAYSKV